MNESINFIEELKNRLNSDIAYVNKIKLIEEEEKLELEELNMDPDFQVWTIIYSKIYERAKTRELFIDNIKKTLDEGLKNLGIILGVKEEPEIEKKKPGRPREEIQKTPEENIEDNFDEFDDEPDIEITKKEKIPKISKEKPIGVKKKFEEELKKEREEFYNKLKKDDKQG